MYAQIGQLIESGTFSAFDSGPVNNQLIYGQNRPPEYPISRIRSRDIAIYYGLNDKLSNFTDVEGLISKLPGKRLINYLYNMRYFNLVPLREEYLVPYANWSHQDFHWGIHSGQYVNSKILSLLKSYVNY